MKFTIVPPKNSGKEPFIKEFSDWREVDDYLLSKNESIWRAEPLNEEINFPMKEIQ